MNRGLSLLVVAVYVAVAVLYGAPADALRVFAAALLPLACIWFPDAMGEYSGTMRLYPITSSTPATFVLVAGWILLVGLPLLVLWIVSASEQT